MATAPPVPKTKPAAAPPDPDAPKREQGGPGMGPGPSTGVVEPRDPIEEAPIPDGPSAEPDDA